jgi:glyoxylase-like metal-dependent hydrolase (beta-lactamase superfamily II)
MKFTGGVLETNAYFFEAPEGNILFDAPQGVCDWLESLGTKPHLLLLTHGHFDHVTDAAEVKERFGAKVAIHAEDKVMVTEADFFQRMGFALPVAPVVVDFEIEPGQGREFLGARFDVFHVPGHSPGSVCFLDSKNGVLVGGDVLFAGGIGRSDLPGGDGELLLSGIHEKLLPLPGNIIVLPGHGPSTTIEDERDSNPFLEFLKSGVPPLDRRSLGEGGSGGGAGKG